MMFFILAGGLNRRDGEKISETTPSFHFSFSNPSHLHTLRQSLKSLKGTLNIYDGGRRRQIEHYGQKNNLKFYANTSKKHTLEIQNFKNRMPPARFSSTISFARK